MSEPKKIGVMTINVCMSVAGVRNRHLPRDLALSAFTAAGIGIYLGLSKLGPWGWRSLLAGAAAQVPLTVVLCFVGGLPLTRLGSLCCLPFAWWDDWKHQRIDELLHLLSREEHADVDVVCVQECYDALVLPGGYPARLAAALAALGFEHCVRAPRAPDAPATLAQNSGLLIASRRAIVRSERITFGLSVESCNVNRGALHAELAGGLHVFTCHVTPGPGVASAYGKGIYAPAVLRARRAQARELCAFIARVAGPGAPAVLAGDLNLGVTFRDAQGRRSMLGVAQPQPEARRLLADLHTRCGLQEATAAARGGEGGEGGAGGGAAGGSGTLAHLRPTFGYTGEGGGAAERCLTSFGDDGGSHCSCDDAVCFRPAALRLLSVAEVPLEIPAPRRPAPPVTHVSDHWAVKACFLAPA